MAIKLEKLEQIENRESLSEKEEREKIGPELVETFGYGGKRGVKAAQILIKNNMSYYAYKHISHVTEGIEHIDNLSYRYAYAQLVKFIYDNHGMYDGLLDNLSELLTTNDPAFVKESAFRSRYHRLYDVDVDRDVADIAEDEFGEELEHMDIEDAKFKSGRGKERIQLSESGREGIVRSTSEYVEFELHKMVSRKLLDVDSDASEFIKKTLMVVYEVVEDIGRERDRPDGFEEVVDKLLDISENTIGDIGRGSFKCLVGVSPVLTDDEEKRLMQSLFDCINSGFSLDVSDLLVDYVLENEAEIVREQEVIDNIRRSYNIKQSSSIISYRTNKQTRRAYVALAQIYDIDDYKIRLIRNGFVGFLS